MQRYAVQRLESLNANTRTTPLPNVDVRVLQIMGKLAIEENGANIEDKENGIALGGIDNINFENLRPEDIIIPTNNADCAAVIPFQATLNSHLLSKSKNSMKKLNENGAVQKPKKLI